jgi:hypothetical protein
MCITETSPKTITGIEPETDSVVSPFSEAVVGVFDHCALATKLARLMPLFPKPLPLPEPYKVLLFRQIAMPDSRPIAIDTRRPLSDASWALSRLRVLSVHLTPRSTSPGQSAPSQAG